MSKKQLDELLGLEKFNPLKNTEQIKGGNVRITVHDNGDTVIKRLKREIAVQ